MLVEPLIKGSHNNINGGRGEAMVGVMEEAGEDEFGRGGEANEG